MSVPNTNSSHAHKDTNNDWIYYTWLNIIENFVLNGWDDDILPSFRGH